MLPALACRRSAASHARPEILDADLAPLLLDALVWGASPAELPLPTLPPSASLEAAKRTLIALGAAKEEYGRLVITPHGKDMARLPLHPRLAHMTLRAWEIDPAFLPLAACLSALTEERDPLYGRAGADIRFRLAALKDRQLTRLRRSAEQIYRFALPSLSGPSAPFRLPSPEEENEAGMLLSLAWPERIARRRGTGYLLASGREPLFPRGML